MENRIQEFELYWAEGWETLIKACNIYRKATYLKPDVIKEFNQANRRFQIGEGGSSTTVIDLVDGLADEYRFQNLKKEEGAK